MGFSPWENSDFKDIEFTITDEKLEIIFTPMGCHSEDCQYSWYLTRDELALIAEATAIEMERVKRFNDAMKVVKEEWGQNPNE